MPKAKIDQLLQERRHRHTPLQRLLNTAADQVAWTAEVRSVLPKNLRNACQARSIRGNALVLVCLDSATATKVRFMEAELIERLKALPHFSQIRRIRAKVAVY